MAFRRIFIAFLMVSGLATICGNPANSKEDGGERFVKASAGTVARVTTPDVFSEVVLFATNSIYLKQNSEVLSGNIVVNEASEGPTLAFGVELTVGIATTTGEGVNLKADSIKVRQNASIAGDVHTNDLDNNGTINGTITEPLPLPVFESWPEFVSAPSGGEDILVGKNEVIAIFDGTYGDIEIKQNGTLIFLGITFNVRSINGGPGANILFSSPTEVRVEEKFATSENSFIGPDTGSSINAGDIIFYINGINGTNGNLGASVKAAKVGLNNELQANMYVPNGTLKLRQGTQATGSFLARDIIVGLGVGVSLESAFVNSAPVAGDDQAQVINGGTVTTLIPPATSLLVNDQDPDGDLLSVSAVPVSGPDHGTLVLNSDGTFSYTHDGSATTEDSFTYEVCDDGSPVLCTTGAVTISVISEGITVSVEKAGEGSGTILSEQEGINCGTVCSASFDTEEFIYLSAVADEGSVFGGWSGDEDCFDGALAPDGDKHCIATFDPAPPPPDETIEVTISLAGAGSGLVISDPEGIECGETCTATFFQFQRIGLTAIPDPGSIFAGWSGDTGCGELLNGDVDINCIATFEEEPPPPPITYTLRVRVLGSGAGTVSSSPSGIFCDNDCSASFEPGTVNLSVRPNIGSSVVWGDDCSGTGFFTSILMDGDKTCSATID